MNNIVYHSPENPYSHHTAIVRAQPSFPVRFLFRHGRISGRTLDFGCGHGADVRFLRHAGVDITGYDPHFAPTIPVGKFDTILCTYVLNVLLPIEQAHVLMAVSELLHPEGRAFFTVRRDIQRNGFRRHAVHKTQVYQCNVRLPYPSVLRVAHCEIYSYQHLFFPQNIGSDCPLCNPANRVFLLTESATVYAIREKDSPVPSALIVPKQHCTALNELPNRILTALEIVAQRAAMLMDPNLPAQAWETLHSPEVGSHAYLRLAPSIHYR